MEGIDKIAAVLIGIVRPNCNLEFLTGLEQGVTVGCPQRDACPEQVGNSLV